MIPALTVTLFVVLALLCVVTAVYALIGRPVDNLVLGVTGLVGLVLLAVIVIVLVSVIPVGLEIWRENRKAKARLAAYQEEHGKPLNPES